jgi:cell wall-associated NlpC family hydrolase
MRFPGISHGPVLFALLCCVGVPTLAQQQNQEPPKKKSLSEYIQLPPVLTKTKEELAKLLLPTLSRKLLQPNLPFANDPASQLRTAIMNKMGIRYRFYGTNDSGYDCSGFVWRVFQEAGANFQRVAARSLWSQFPEATPEETKQFGTLVFFNDLKHVGIVRDDKTFYHSSTSKGVTVSEFAGYWEKRVTGYRRAPVALLPQLLKSVE